MKLQKKKRSNLADTEKRSVAELLAKGKDDEARIHVDSAVDDTLLRRGVCALRSER